MHLIWSQLLWFFYYFLYVEPSSGNWINKWSVEYVVRKQWNGNNTNIKQTTDQPIKLTMCARAQKDCFAQCGITNCIDFYQIPNEIMINRFVWIRHTSHRVQQQKEQNLWLNVSQITAEWILWYIRLCGNTRNGITLLSDRNFPWDFFFRLFYLLSRWHFCAVCLRYLHVCFFIVAPCYQRCC